MSFPRSISQQAFIVIITLALAAGAYAAPVTATFSPDFTDSASVDDFNEIQNSQWTLNTGSGVYNNTLTAANTASSTAVNVTNVGSGSNFTLTAQFTFNTLGGTDTTVGFGILSPDGNLTDGSGSYYLADVAQSGRIRILELNPSAGSVNINDAITDLVTGKLYTMTLSGVYIGGNLRLTFSVFDGVDTASVTYTDTASILAGPYFGLRNRTSGTGGALNVDFSQFTIAVPSPAALPAGLTLLTLVGLRRRSLV